jgi:type II secretory pathway component PulK
MQPGPDRRSERGIALILVLVILPLVAIIMTQLSFETTIGTRLAANALANQQFKAAIRARITMMRLRLVRDLKDDEANAQDEGGAYDSLGDMWGPDLEGGATVAKVTKGDKDAGDQIDLYTEVVDEQGKFNLNLLLHRDPQRARRALDWFKNILDFYRDPAFGDFTAVDPDLELNAGEAKELAEAVLKFLKGEERDERVRKADLPDPTPEFQQGVYTVEDLVFAHPFFREKRLFERVVDPSSGETLPSLADFITLYGDGKINANTVPIQILRALFKEPEGQQAIAEEILHGRGGYLSNDQDQTQRDEDLEQRREDEAEGVEEDPELESVYRTVNDITRLEGMGDAAMLRRNEIDVQQVFTVRSNFYTVIVTARRENFLRQHRVVLERHATGCITWASEVRSADLGDLPETMTGDAGSEYGDYYGE